MASDDPVKQAFSSVSRVTNLLFSVLALGCCIGLLASALIALAQPNTPLVWAIAGLSATVAIIVFIRMVAAELASRTVSKVVPTAVVINHATNKIAVPLVLRMHPRLIGEPRPFPIMIYQVHRQLIGLELKQPFDSMFLEPIFTLLLALSQKLGPMDDFAPVLASIQRGPFISSKMGHPLDHAKHGIEDIAPSILDTALLRRHFPSLQFNLPKGISMRLAFTDKNQAMLKLSGNGVSFRIEPFGGVGSPAPYTSWDRRFAGHKDCTMQGAAFRLTLTFGGLSLLRIGKRRTPPAWSLEGILSWFQRLFDWTAAYLDWLDTDADIPTGERFDLVEEYPPHYKYSKGVLPPGNGHIVFDMD